MSDSTSPKAYLTIARISGDPEELLDGYARSAAVMAGVGRDHGLILHAAAKADDGVVIVNLWPSKEGSEAAARDPRRLDTLADLGLTPDRFRRDHHDVVNLDLFRQI
jgi:hypothetical protein